LFEEEEAKEEEEEEREEAYLIHMAETCCQRFSLACSILAFHCTHLNILQSLTYHSPKSSCCGIAVY
jgi:hypothetical protein